MRRLTQKTSTILIAVGRKTRMYRSMTEVPPELRRRLSESTSGPASGTILIADEGGRREIVRSLEGRPSALESRMVASLLGRTTKAVPTGRLARLTWRHWMEIGLVGGIGLCLWLLAAWR